MENLKEQAEALGIEVDGRWSDRRLAAEIAKAKGDADAQVEIDETVTVENLTPRAASFIGLPPFGVITLSAHQKSKASIMRAIAHGVKLGQLKVVKVAAE